MRCICFASMLLCAGCLGGPSGPAAGQTPVDRPRVMAVINGEPIHAAQMSPLLLEAAGAEVLMDLVLDRQVYKALADKGLVLTDQDVLEEKKRFESQLADDPETSSRLAAQVQQRRGLGPNRYQSLLRRSAGLRKLVSAEVRVTEAMVKRAFDQAHGIKIEGRMILVPTLAEAQKAMVRLKQGESFIDLAIKLSTDQSRRQGGLLPPISPLDATYPKAVRQALVALAPGKISSPVALANGFAILRCERRINPAEVRFEEAAPGIRQQLRLQLESTLMQRKARAMLDRADVTAFDAALNAAWKRKLGQMALPDRPLP